MSAKSLSLKSPVVITVVLVLMAAVTVLNIRTFGPKKHHRGAKTARAQAYPVLPSDLSDLVHQASLDIRGDWHEAAVEEVQRVNPDRDPFFEPKSPPTSAPVVTRSARGRPRAKSTRLPKCTAVLLGGARPLALIDGHTYGENDEISGYKILRINSKGVLLADKSGHPKTLAVGSGGGTGTFTVSVVGGDPLAQVHKERNEK